MISPKKICSVIEEYLVKANSKRLLNHWAKLENMDYNSLSNDLLIEDDNEQLNIFEFFGRLQSNYYYRLYRCFVYKPFIFLLLVSVLTMVYCMICNVTSKILLYFYTTGYGIVFLIGLISVLGQLTKGFRQTDRPLFYQFKVKYPEKSDEEIERIICSADWG